MNCKRTRAQIALWVGQDLEQHAQGDVEQHLQACACCREFQRRLRSSLNVLHEVGSEPGDVTVSLWPALCGRIAAVDRGPRLAQFNGWLPAVAVAASAAFVLLAARPFERYRPSEMPIGRINRSVLPHEVAADASRNLFPAPPHPSIAVERLDLPTGSMPYYVPAGNMPAWDVGPVLSPAERHYLQQQFARGPEPQSP